MFKYSMHEIRPNAYEIRRTASGDAFPAYLRGMRKKLSAVLPVLAVLIFWLCVNLYAWSQIADGLY